MPSQLMSPRMHGVEVSVGVGVTFGVAVLVGVGGGVGVTFGVAVVGGGWGGGAWGGGGGGGGCLAGGRCSWASGGGWGSVAPRTPRCRSAGPAAAARPARRWPAVGRHYASPRRWPGCRAKARP